MPQFYLPATVSHTISCHELSQCIKCFEWIYLSWESNEGVFSRIPEHWSTTAFILYLSCYCFFHVIYCCSYCWVAQFFLHHFTSLFYIIPSPSGSGESLIHTGLFSMPLTLLWPALAPSFILPSFLKFFFYFYSQIVPIFCSLVSPLTSTSWEMLLAGKKTSLLKTSSTVTCNFWLIGCLVLKPPSCYRGCCVCLRRHWFHCSNRRPLQPCHLNRTGFISSVINFN